MNNRLLTRLAPVVAIAVVLLAVDAAWACPTCKEALASADGQNVNLVRGFFWSILFMMSMPFLILGTFGTMMYRAVKRAQAEGTQRVANHFTAYERRELVEV